MSLLAAAAALIICETHKPYNELAHCVFALIISSEEVYADLRLKSFNTYIEFVEPRS